jgi:hypothetical protein
MRKAAVNALAVMPSKISSFVYRVPGKDLVVVAGLFE